MRKRIFISVLVLLLLSGIGIVVWTAAGLPPVRMVWRYGFSYHPEPTGKVLPIEGIEFVEIGPGCFRMGSDKNAEGGDWLGRLCARFGLPWGDQPKQSLEMPVHWVEFPRGFWISKYEVTNAQYEAFDPEHERSEYSPGDGDPVVNVSWEDAKKYCAWLSQMSGRAVRLPSESEWECACRGGTEGEFSFGETITTDEVNYDPSFEAGLKGENRERTVPAGSLPANPWGLYEMHGNVWEWCQDTWNESYEDAPATGGAREEGGSSSRVQRGGSWLDDAWNSRSANRNGEPPGFRYDGLGFRPAFSPSAR